MVQYFPILKWKAGEETALSNLNVSENQMMPVIQIVDDTSPATFFNTLATYYPYPIYFDTFYHPNEDDAYSILNEYIQFSLNNNIDAYPVFDYNAIAHIPTGIVKCGVYFPVPHDYDGPSSQEIMQNIFAHIGEIEIDLFLNAGSITSQHEANMVFQTYTAELIQLMNYESVNKYIICLTSFPENLSSIPRGGSTQFQRFDIQIFNLIRQNPTFQAIKEKLHYSDYGVTKYTGTDMDFSLLRYGILPKIKYTTNDQYLVFKGSNNPPVSYVDLANIVINSPYYSGQNFSFGDEQIYSKAQGTNGVGNNTNWVTYCCNHHLAAVLEQLSRML